MPRRPQPDPIQLEPPDRDGDYSAIQIKTYATRTEIILGWIENGSFEEEYEITVTAANKDMLLPLIDQLYESYQTHNTGD